MTERPDDPRSELRTLELDDDVGENPSVGESSRPPEFPSVGQPLARPPSAALSLVAVLVVAALAATLFVALGGRQGASTAAAALTPTAPASPSATVPAVQPPVQGNLPVGVELTDFALTGPDSGWGTGVMGIDPRTSVPARSVLLRYTGGTWTQVGNALDGIRLGGLAMAGEGDGWALGGDSSGHSLMLRISGETWQQEALPSADPNGAPAVMRLRTPDDAWLAMANVKTAYSGANTSLLHDAAGSWSLVSTPLYWINDIAPVGPGEAWVVGRLASGASAAVHVQGGVATIAMTTLGATDLYDLRALSESDIWADGARHAPDNNDAEDTPLVYHFNGTAWQSVDLHTPPDVQRIQITGNGTAWGSASVNPPLHSNTPDPNTELQAFYTLRSGQWRQVPLPYADLTALTALRDGSLQAGDGELWALGSYMVFTKLSDHNGASSYSGIGHTVLLHFAGGRWTEYGR